MLCLWRTFSLSPPEWWLLLFFLLSSSFAFATKKWYKKFFCQEEKKKTTNDFLTAFCPPALLTPCSRSVSVYLTHHHRHHHNAERKNCTISHTRTYNFRRQRIKAKVDRDFSLERERERERARNFSKRGTRRKPLLKKETHTERDGVYETIPSVWIVRVQHREQHEECSDAAEPRASLLHRRRFVGDRGD